MITVFILLAIILLAAKLGGEVCERFRQPAVLGELLAGVILGNFILVFPGFTLFESLRSGAHEIDGVHVVASIGVVLLLFEAGLETTLAEMKRVGTTSLLVALVGVCVPFALGYGASAWLIHEVPDAIRMHSPQFPLVYVHLFVGATLSATSVGITARVFKDLDIMRSIEARIVLGAAVIDDVIGLVILAVVGSVVTAAIANVEVQWLTIMMTCVTTFLFLAGALVAGITIVPRAVNAFSKWQSRGMMVTAALVICFVFAGFAGLAGLAPIVGAFAAGLVLEDVHFAGFSTGRTVRELVSPIVDFVAPVFFVLIGIQVHVEQFVRIEVLSLGCVLIIAAVAGKAVSGLAARGDGTRRWIVGLGMIPRGEVGLVFAGIGRASGVFDDHVFAALILVVAATTMMTPILLKRALTDGPTHGSAT